MKKNILLSATLLCSTILCSKMFADQNATLTEAEELQQGMELLSSTYQEITKSYDKNDIEKYEQTISATVKTYLLNCAKDAENVKNVSVIEKEASAIVEALAAKTNKNEALATTGMMFTLTISKVMTEVEAEITEQREVENLSSASEEISKFIERFFILPLQEATAQKTETTVVA